MEKERLMPDYIFEVSWEVCNLVGGIYTVLSTKAKTLQRLNKDRNIFIGPDVWKDKDCPYFKEVPSLLKDWKKQLVLPDGLTIRVGRWEVPGRPIAILVDFEKLYIRRDELFSNMWQWYGVDSLPAYGDYDEACMFAYASALVIENFYNYVGGDQLKMIAHFDEWTTGVGLLYLKHQLPHIATLFTTHATSIGRSIAGNNKPLYDYLVGYNGDQMAQELNMVSKHSLEKRAAKNADCFTTVSDITARECTQLLERTPDVVTVNGFEENFVPAGAIYQEKRTIARDKLLKVASSLIGYKPSKDSFLLATSGRYEYKNKGIDLFIDSLRRLKENYADKREIIAFILVPAYVNEARADLSDRMSTRTNFKESLPDPLITHTLHNYNEDRVMAQLHAAGFKNNAEDKIKIIFVPSYLTGQDGILDLPYYDLLIGFDATAFPSYYEPWGYTPLESIAFGVPTITTDLSGFGLWVKSLGNGGLKEDGVSVLHRTDSDFNEIADELSETVRQLALMSATEKKIVDKAASATARQAEWKHFIGYYQVAYDIALRKKTNFL